MDEDAPNYPVHLASLKRAYVHRAFPKTGRTLDLGCGAGCWSFRLEEMCFAVTGLGALEH